MREVQLRFRDGGTEGAEGRTLPPPQILTDQLTLSQPDGVGQIINYCTPPPPIFSDLPTSLRVWQLIAVGVFQRLGDTDRWNYWYWLVPLCYTKWIIFLPCEIALIYIYSSPIAKMKNCHKFRHSNSNQFHLNKFLISTVDN